MAGKKKKVGNEIIFFRDGFPAEWTNIMLCAGASEGIRACLKLMTNPGN